MKISTRGRYGLRALIDLAENSGEGCVSLSDIAARQDVSLNYLESIFACLKRAGIVKGIAGAAGGYILTRPAKYISLSEILLPLEGSLSVSGADSACEESEIRLYLRENLWNKIDENVKKVLSETTLQSILDNMKI